MRRIFFLLALLSSVAFAQNGLINMDNISPQPPGTTVTSTILANGTVGTGLGTPALTGTPGNFTVGAHNSKCSLPENITVSGITYTPAMPSQSLNELMTSQFTYWTTPVTNSPIYSWSACITVPGGSPSPSLIDLSRTDSDNGKLSVFQLANNGTCARIERDTFATSGCVTISPSQTFWATYKVDNTNGLNTLKLYQPIFPYTSIGVVTVPQAVGGNIFRFLVGNSQTGTSSGTMTLENQIFDPNGAFPFDTITPSFLWSGILAPSRAVDWSHAGVAGGVPTRSTIFTTLTGPLTATTINNALASCPAGQVVALAAGTYPNLGPISYGGSTGNNCTLRGAGADLTILQFTSTSGCAGSQCSIAMKSADANSRTSISNGPVTVSGTLSAGSATITLSSTPNLRVGNPLILDQCNTGTSGPTCTTGGTVDNGAVLVTDSTATGTAVAPGSVGPYSLQGNSGGAQRTGRQQYQIVTVMQCDGVSTPGHLCSSGANVGIDPPIYMPNWSSSLTPQAWWATTPGFGMGVENLTIDNTGVTNTGICSGVISVGMDNVYNSYVKGVRSIDSNFAHVQFRYSAHNTVQDSYFYLTQNWSTCSYGISSFVASDNLVLNNIFQAIAAPTIWNGGIGNVEIYNFTRNIFFQGSTFNGNGHGDHSSGVDFNLYEGNDDNYYDADVIHGTHNFGTIHRSLLSGTQAACWINSTDLSTSARALATGTFGACTNPLSPINVGAFSRFYNFTGNILGTTGVNTTYNTGSQPVYGFGGGNSPVPSDSNTASTAMLFGNCDPVTGFSSCRFVAGEVPSGLTGAQAPFANPVPASNTLPPSYYYPSKPSWWPVSKPWPAIGPDVSGGNISGISGHAYSIPARDCYFNTMLGPTNGVSTVLSFNADTCYNGGSSSPVASLSPTSLIFAGQTIGMVSPSQTVTISNIGTASLTITALGISGDFAIQSNTCGALPATVTVGNSCTASITFTPTQLGVRSGTFSVTDNASGSPHTVSLTGTGVPPTAPVTKLFALAR